MLRSVGRCAMFGFVLLGQRNHKMHIAHIDRLRLVDVRCSVLYFLAREITRCRSHISTDSGWSMCDVLFCTWPEKSQDAYRTSRPSPLVASKKLRDFTPTSKLPLRVWWEYSHQAKMSHFRKWFKFNFSSWPDESTLTILAKVVYWWAWNCAIFCSLLCSPVDVRYLFLYLLARKSQHNMHHRTSTSRRQLVPFFWTISILDKSPKVSTTDSGWHIWRFVQNGDCPKKGTSCRRLTSTDSIYHLFCTAVGNSPPFLTNLPFHDSANTVNHELWLKYLAKSWKGRFVKNGGELPTAGFVSLGQKINMHHRTSTDSIHQSMCAICFCISWPEKQQIHRTTLPDSNHQSMCDICFCISWQEKITTCIIAHRPDSNHQSMCDICFCISWQEKITTCIIAHRPIRFASRCAISVFPCGKQHFREIATPDWVGPLRRFTHTRKYVLFVKWPTQSGVAISLKCCFPHGCFCISWPENHNTTCIIAHRPDSNRQ